MAVDAKLFAGIWELVDCLAVDPVAFCATLLLVFAGQREASLVVIERRFHTFVFKAQPTSRGMATFTATAPTHTSVKPFIVGANVASLAGFFLKFWKAILSLLFSLFNMAVVALILQVFPCKWETGIGAVIEV